MPARIQPLILQPIGIARTALKTRVEAARQPRSASGCDGTIELYSGRNFEHALEDLAGWEMIWVVFWFHLNSGWRPKVLPPRSATGRKGVFATRAPHRPNPIGISAVTLQRIEGLMLFVGNVDLLDGTPVLDIKPYVPYSDAFPQARSGWLEDAARSAAGAAPDDPVSAYTVSFDDLAAAQAAWIEAKTGLDLRQRITATLSLGPEPHPYRRIRREAHGLRLAVRDWRVGFRVSGRQVLVLWIRSGYRTQQIAAGAGEAIELHREYLAAWPDQ